MAAENNLRIKRAQRSDDARARVCRRVCVCARKNIYHTCVYVVCGTNFITVCRACLGHFNYCSSLYGENNNKKDLLKDRFRMY